MAVDRTLACKCVVLVVEHQGNKTSVLANPVDLEPPRQRSSRTLATAKQAAAQAINYLAHMQAEQHRGRSATKVELKALFGPCNNRTSCGS